MNNIHGFQATVSKAWNTFCYGNPMTVFCKKFKSVKSELVKFNKVHASRKAARLQAARDAKPVKAEIMEVDEDDIVKMVCKEYDVEVIDAAPFKVEDMEKKKEIFDKEDLNKLEDRLQAGKQLKLADIKHLI
ncbi:hypothetical protein AgCh_010077 [Apium graveolens]